MRRRYKAKNVLTMSLPTLNRQVLQGTRSLAPEKIIQFGGGNFLRAFVDWMVDEMNEKTDFRGSVVIVKPTPSGNYDDLIQQEGLFHVLSSGIKEGTIVNDINLVQSVSRVVQPYQDFASYLQLAESTDFQIIVSNTTEAGIVFDAKDQFTDQPADSFPGKLTQLLHRRYRVHPDIGFVILPCELIEKNGAQLRTCVLQYAQHWQLGSDFEDWVSTKNSFCNTLVDRIVPGFPEERAATIFEQIQVVDNLLVAAEPYHLWVIEGDDHARYTFPIHQTGLNAHFAEDLTPYRTIKVRVLNGAHTAMTVFGYLFGCRTVGECMQHPTVSVFIRALVYEAILPTLPYRLEEKTQYAAATLDRFRNPFVQHRLSDIALNSISKFQVRLLPSMLWYLKNNQAPPLPLVQALAYLLTFYKGSWKNEQLPVRDHASVLTFFKNVSELPTPQAQLLAILKQESLWGEDLSVFPLLVDRLEQEVLSLWNA